MKRLYIILSIILLCSSCSDDGDSSETKLNVKIGKLSQGSATSLLSHFSPSTTNFAWASLDEFIVYLDKIIINGEPNDHLVINYEDDPQPINLASEDAFSFEGTIVGGTYFGANASFETRFDIKAYGHTATKTCYTTATGVVCEDGNIDPSAFTDYATFSYDYLYIEEEKSADPLTVGEDTFFTDKLVVEAEFVKQVDEETGEEENVEVEQGMNLSLLVDTHRMAKLWDGTGSKPDTSPFNFGYDPSEGEYFEAGIGHFASNGYLSAFVSFEPPSTTVSGQTYIFSDDESKVDAYSSDSGEVTDVQFFSLVVTDSGKYIGSRVNSTNHWPLLDQFTNGWDVQDNGTINFHNTNHYNSLKPDGTFIKAGKDYLVSGFEIAELNEKFTTIYENGPDCGKERADGEFYSDCLETSPTTLYWKRVR